MNAREMVLSWMDQFENDHYEFDVYGEMVKVDLPRATVEKVMDISIFLVDRVVAAKGELSTAEYEELEENARKKYPDDSSWLFHVVMDAFLNERLFGWYMDIEPMIGDLMPRGYSRESAAYLLTVRPEIHKLIYAVIRHVDDIEENYNSLVYTFFLGVIAKGWGEGYKNLGECGRPGRYFMSSGDEPGKAFYLHLCHKSHQVAQDQLLFQHLERANEDIFWGYYKLKTMLASQFPDDRAMYRELKGIYIEGVLSAYRMEYHEGAFKENILEMIP